MSTSEVTEWCEMSEVPALGQSEIHVWRINLARQFIGDERRQSCLSAEEQQRAASFRFAQDQKRFVARRVILRQLLAAYLKKGPELVRFEFTSTQKPFLPDQRAANEIRFNTSHSADWALIAISSGIELGVDLEQCRAMTDAEDLARAFFSNAEINELAQMPQALKLRAFFNGWTRKEAFVKAIGLGFSYPFNRFSVSLAADKPAALLEVADDPEALKKWSLISLEVAPDVSAALVFEGKPSRVKFFEWNPPSLD